MAAVRYASNMEEVRQVILDQIEQATKEVSSKILLELRKATTWFYTGKQPKYYKRTYFLMNSPKVEHVYRYSNHITMRALLNAGKHCYTTGDKPSAEQVFELANNGNAWRTQSGAMAKDTVGKKGFWEKGTKNAEKAFNNAFKKYFK